MKYFFESTFWRYAKEEQFGLGRPYRNNIWEAFTPIKDDLGELYASFVDTDYILNVIMHTQRSD